MTTRQQVAEVVRLARIGRRTEARRVALKGCLGSLTRLAAGAARTEAGQC